MIRELLFATPRVLFRLYWHVPRAGNTESFIIVKSLTGSLLVLAALNKSNHSLSSLAQKLRAPYSNDHLHNEKQRGITLTNTTHSSYR